MHEVLKKQNVLKNLTQFIDKRSKTQFNYVFIEDI